MDTARAFLGFAATSLHIVSRGNALYWTWVGVLLALIVSGVLKNTELRKE